ncbi:MAG: ATP-binding protein [Rickettsiales bacterium]
MMMRVPHHEKPESSLKARITIMVVLGLSAIAAVILLFLAGAFKERSESILRERARVIATINAQSLAMPLWDYNEDQVQSILGALSGDSDFIYGVVFDQENKVFAEQGKVPETINSLRGIRISQDIIYNDGKKNEKIGTLEVYFSTDSITAALNKALKLVLPSFMLFAALVGIVVFNIVRGFTLPIEQLAEAMANYQRGQKDFLLPKNISTREMQNLVLAFSDMKEKYDHFNEELQKQVDSRTEELKEYQEHLERLVEDQVKDIKKAKEEAETANRIKSEFLANMSHELRTPVHAIINYSAMGETGVDKVEKEKILKYFVNINKSGSRLLSLLNNLLDLSKMEAGSMEYNFREHHLGATAEYVFEELRSLIEAKELQLDKQYRTENMRATYDEPSITQVLVNLLSNAIKFSDNGKKLLARIEDGILTVGTSKIPAVTFILEDQGVGIPDEELELIFDKFVQSKKTKTGAGGTGLGLAICKSIVEAHNGRIWAENTGGGARFTVMIPRFTISLDDLAKNTFSA